ncbi:MAG: cytochrome c-type biogenesis protein CcmH [Acidimicrobiaceae bacterium]|nr:cytochrome c-type biogenesis protein CcmH [Acidimicrobiaceae bacterium]
MTQVLRRWGPWAALVVVLAAVLAIGANRADNHLSVQQQTMSLAGRVRCPVCQGESAAQSDTPSAASIRQRIHADLLQGESSGEILRSLEASYGASILESPPTSGISLWAWVTPVVVVAAAAAGLVLGFRHWRRPSLSADSAPTRGRGLPAVSPRGLHGGSPAGISAEDQALVREAMAARTRGGRE